MSYPVECVSCGATGQHDVIDPLIPDPDHVAYACPNCDTIYRAES